MLMLELVVLERHSNYQRFVDIVIKKKGMISFKTTTQVIFNLDGDIDPVGMIYNIEYLAIRSQHTSWLLNAANCFRKDGHTIALLPICSFGMGLCGGIDRLNHVIRGVRTWPELANLLVKADDYGIRSVQLDHDIIYPAEGSSSDVIIKVYVSRMNDIWGQYANQQLLLQAIKSVNEDVKTEELVENINERITLLGSHHCFLKPNAVIGVVDEIMAGVRSEADRRRLQSMWTPEMNLLPDPVRESLLDTLTGSDFSLLRTMNPVLLFLSLLCPWNSVPRYLMKTLLKRWREDNHTEAREWDREIELHRRIGQIQRDRQQQLDAGQ